MSQQSEPTRALQEIAFRAATATDLELPWLEDETAASVAARVDEASTSSDWHRSFEHVKLLEQNAQAARAAANTLVDRARHMRDAAYCSGGRRATERVRAGLAASSLDVTLAAAYEQAAIETKARVESWRARDLGEKDRPTEEQEQLLRQGFAARALAAALQLAAEMGSGRCSDEDIPAWADRVVRHARVAVGSKALERWREEMLGE